MSENDTIVAISTPVGNSAIGVVRVSGSKTFDIVNKIFLGKKSIFELESHTVAYGSLVSPFDGEKIDEVLIIKMDGPSTFTKEDTVEINCHGNMIILKEVVETLIKLGARLAEPGEFTKKAFINGRIDLVQAEAVIDLINAKTLKSSKLSMSQLEGKLSIVVKEIREILIEVIAHIEAVVDYPEYDIEDITENTIREKLYDVKEKLINLGLKYARGKILREGLTIAIVGKPNVGKSSLLNELSGRNRSIVTDIPGTTRDIIEEYVDLKGIPVRLIDTAGIRKTEDVVEKIGVDLSKEVIKTCDIVIFMVEAAGFDAEDKLILEEIERQPFILAINKIDTLDNIDNIKTNLKLKDDIISKFNIDIGQNNYVLMSVKKGLGIDTLIDLVYKKYIGINTNTNEEIILSNIRHKSLVERALKSVENALEALDANMPVDCLTIDIKDAAEYLGQITGQAVSEDVLNEIFSRFCIGK